MNSRPTGSATSLPISLAVASPPHLFIRESECNWSPAWRVIQLVLPRCPAERSPHIVHHELAADIPVDQLSRKRQAADRAGFDGLITPLVEPAYRLAFAMLRQRMAAEDAVQEATLKAWNKFATFRNERGGFRAWYLTIVANASRSLQRGRWWSVLRFDQVRPPQVSDESAMTASDLRQTIARLSPPARPLLYLFCSLCL